MLMTMLSLLPFLLLVYVIANFTNKIISVVKDAFVGLKKIKLYEKNNNCKVIYLLNGEWGPSWPDGRGLLFPRLRLQNSGAQIA